ncbi:unnamed protein product [Clonostachys solani]|uniref:Uncharacterized protein n=1 Tax=Clonostachys solani TaxID=160281 RepID=A0A9N9WA75_9HYPO|nr:unnamed protein product [Clonostachys solani]
MVHVNLVVDLLLGAHGEASLGTIVVVAKIMSIARRSERESERVVRRRGASVRGPVDGVGVKRISTGCEGWKRDAEQDLVGDGLDALARLDDWGDSCRRDDGNDREADSSELHLEMEDSRV